MTKQTAIKDPPEQCRFCSKERIGIQEGLIIFACGTFFRYDKEAELKEIRRSTECLKKTESIG